jgi:hypothetical protein
MIIHWCSALKDKLNNEICFVILFFTSDIFSNNKGLLEFVYTRIQQHFTSNELSEDPDITPRRSSGHASWNICP